MSSGENWYARASFLGDIMKQYQFQVRTRKIFEDTVYVNVNANTKAEAFDKVEAAVNGGYSPDVPYYYIAERDVLDIKVLEIVDRNPPRKVA